MRLTKRLHKHRLLDLFITIGSLVLSILLAASIFLFYGINPLTAFSRMVKAAFFEGYGFRQTLIKTVPLALCAFSVIMCFKMKLWNIGAEGQLYIGGLFASIIALRVNTGPAIITIPLLLTAGAITGGIWGFIAGYLKAKLEMNEILSTLMLNYIAITLVEYAAYGPFKGADRFPYSKPFRSEACLPTLFSDVHIGIILVIIFGVLLHLLMEHTRFGYKIKVCGSSRETAEYAGFNYTGNIITVLFISGALAGIAGMIEVTGVQHRLQPVISSGYGFTAILVAWLSKQNFLFSIVVAFLFGGLIVSGEELQIAMRLPSSIIGMFQGILFITILGSEIFKEYKLELK
ncbi:ABC transporter permease [bacterium]|nr:ABC transporter permease [bacterium]